MINPPLPVRREEVVHVMRKLGFKRLRRLGMYEGGAVSEAPVVMGMLRSARGMTQPSAGCPCWLVIPERGSDVGTRRKLVSLSVRQEEGWVTF